MTAPILLFSMMAHEYAHGYAALKQGDMTASDGGYLTWDPRKQIDPFMTILLPLMLAMAHQPILGGVKGVPTVAANYKHFVRGSLIVSLAGIAANVGLAVLCVPMVMGLGYLGRGADSVSGSIAVLQLIFLKGVELNLLLAMFNLLPIPPLDGSHALEVLLPKRLAYYYKRIGMFGFILLIALLNFGSNVLTIWFTPAAIGYRFAQFFWAPYMLPNPFST